MALEDTLSAMADLIEVKDNGLLSMGERMSAAQSLAAKADALLAWFAKGNPEPDWGEYPAVAAYLGRKG